MSEETRVVLERLHVATDGTSKKLSPEMVRKADLVLAMTRSHVGGVRVLAGSDASAAQKVVPLDPTSDIADPIGHGPEVYEEVGRRLLELIPKRLKEMLSP